MEEDVACLMPAAAREYTATDDARTTLPLAAPEATQQAPRQSFRRCHGPMGANLDAAVAADAAIVVKVQTIVAALNGSRRAVLPAFAAQATCIGIGHRPAQKVTPQEGLQAFRAKARRAGIRQLERNLARPVADDLRKCTGDTKGVGRRQGRQLFRG